ncbi:MAG: class I SAM-dependent RNA methyltransferase [Candidatus Latescibacteria bacterium]|nr:class I SAM-dependent RNA methyltransferase [Candidatus Latescibacterota bacterium]
MYIYQQENRYFAQIADGMEQLGVEELHELGAQEMKTAYRGIYFVTDRNGLYRINYMSRLLTKIYAAIRIFSCHSDKYLYRNALAIDWKEFFSVNNTFAVTATVSHSKIKHSKFAALRLKDAIVDYFRKHFGKRPDVDTTIPDIRIDLHIENNRAVISIDTSGGSLHRRGYRKVSVDAPMQETVAAAIIRLSDWDGSQPLYDPMCGSGTLLCEAFMQYCRIPAGIHRDKFGFEYLPDFDKALWKTVKTDAGNYMREIPLGIISGSDISREAVNAAKLNLGRLPHGGSVCVKVTDFQKISSLENSIIVCNPPYGIRMGEKENIGEFYHEFGEFLKHKCKGSNAFIYFGDRSLIKHFALRASWKKPLKNGGLDGQLAKFELY